MNRLSDRVLFILSFILVTGIANGQNMATTDTLLPSWEFNIRNNFEGWTVPTPLDGKVEGGALWIKPSGYSNQRGTDIIRFSGLNWKTYEIISPSDIQCPGELAKKLQIRLLNHSPETDGYVYWRTCEEPENWLGPVRFAINPYNNHWQDVTCHLDDIEWKGRLKQMRICIGLKGVAGDIFIDRIRLKYGLQRVKPDRPDILGKDGVPRIKVPGISQESIDAAYAVLNDAVVYDPLPYNGFPCPFLAPGAGGAYYGNNWWVLDGSLGLIPLVWTDPSFAIHAIEGYMHIQAENPDGRFTHEGKIAMRGLPGDLDVIPRYFESASAIARISTDKLFLEAVYRSMHSYLDWWLSPVKLDKAKGLVSGYFEESFSKPLGVIRTPGSALQVDLNVAVAVGADLTRAMAERLGYNDDVLKLKDQRDELIKAINTTLWSEKEQCYLNFDTKTGMHEKILSNSMFDCFRLQIAPPERREALIKRLIDPAEFGWGKFPLTSVSRKDLVNFTVIRGDYYGPQWNGMVWTFRNIPIIQGLRDIGRHDLAAELSWSTLREFDQKYAEYLDPNDGSAQGVKRYTWSAAQWIQCLIEQLFGVTYDAGRKTLECFPHVPADLYGQKLSLQNLVLPGTNRAMVGIEILTSSNGLTTDVEVSIERGLLPEGSSIEISHAGSANLVTEKAKSLRGKSGADGSTNWSFPLTKTIKVRMIAGQ